MVAVVQLLTPGCGWMERWKLEQLLIGKTIWTPDQQVMSGEQGWAQNSGILWGFCDHEWEGFHSWLWCTSAGKPYTWLCFLYPVVIHPGCAHSGICSREQEESDILATSSSRKFLTAPELTTSGTCLDYEHQEIQTRTVLLLSSVWEGLVGSTWSKIVSWGLQRQLT